MAALETTTYAGFPEGMNVAWPSAEIKDSQAVYIQDGWIHRPGFTERRGPLTPVPGMVTFADKAIGVVQAADPQGTSRIAIVHGSSNIELGILSSNFSSKVDVTIGTGFSTAPYLLVDSKPMLNGGALIGISTQYEVDSANQYLILWRGANLADYTTGTVTTTYGSRSVTGAGTFWVANVAPGMFLFDNTGFYVGTVVSVQSDTALTLEEPPLAQLAANAATFKSIRGWQPKIVAGHITASTANASVTGANTKFLDQGVAANWKLFKAETMQFVGTVLSVQSNTALTLTANALINMTNDDYELVSNAPNTSFAIKDVSDKPGFINAVYAERQWYANKSKAADQGGEYVNRLWFSDVTGPEALDLSAVDGDFIPVTSSRGVDSAIRALLPAYNSMLVLKEREAFVLVGNNPNNFEVRKLADDGILSGMSAASYEGGVIWAGREGIYFYDGVEATNIVEETLGTYYAESVKSFDPRTYRMWGMVHRDHYFLHIERATPSVAVVKGNVSVTPTQFTIAIYMPRRAVSIFTNVNFRGGANLTGQSAWFAVNTSSIAKVCTMDSLFDTDGNDPFACDGGTAGPDFYIESKKYSAGDGLRKKLWKQLMLHYLVGGDSLRLDTVVGLNTVGSTSTSTWPVTVYWWDKLSTLFNTWDTLKNSYPTWDSVIDSVFFIKRIKFLKRSQYLAFRIYQNSPSVNKATLGNFALGFKKQRVGRI